MFLTIRKAARTLDVPERLIRSTARIQAARSLLEYGLRLTETVDVMKQLNELEQWRDKVDGND